MELRSGGLKRRMGMSAVLGALAALGLAPYGLWPITLAILALIPWLLRGVAKKRNAALIGWALGAGYFAHALIWIVEPFLVDVQRHGWMGTLCRVLSGWRAGPVLGCCLCCRTCARIQAWAAKRVSDCDLVADGTGTRLCFDRLSLGRVGADLGGYAGC